MRVLTVQRGNTFVRIRICYEYSKDCLALEEEEEKEGGIKLVR